MKKRLALTLATAGVLALGGGVATAFAVQGNDDPDDRPGTARSEEPVPTGAFTAAQAAETAAKTVPGVVTDVDWDDNRWEVDVRAKDNSWREVVLDKDGKVLSNQPDDRTADDQDPDDQDDD